MSDLGDFADDDRIYRNWETAFWIMTTGIAITVWSQVGLACIRKLMGADKVMLPSNKPAHWVQRLICGSWAIIHLFWARDPFGRQHLYSVHWRIALMYVPLGLGMYPFMHLARMLANVGWEMAQMQVPAWFDKAIKAMYVPIVGGYAIANIVFLVKPIRLSHAFVLFACVIASSTCGILWFIAFSRAIKVTSQHVEEMQKIGIKVATPNVQREGTNSGTGHDSDVASSSGTAASSANNSAFESTHRRNSAFKGTDGHGSGSYDIEMHEPKFKVRSTTPMSPKTSSPKSPRTKATTPSYEDVIRRLKIMRMSLPSCAMNAFLSTIVMIIFHFVFAETNVLESFPATGYPRAFDFFNEDILFPLMQVQAPLVFLPMVLVPLRRPKVEDESNVSNTHSGTHSGASVTDIHVERAS